jgi:hypothetical protein
MSSSIALTVRSGIGTATATILSRLRDKELTPWPFTRNSSLMSLQEKAFVAKKVARLRGQTKPSSPETPFFLRRLALMFKTVTRSRPDLLQ